MSSVIWVGDEGKRTEEKKTVMMGCYIYQCQA